jgi:hypothetical protein
LRASKQDRREQPDSYSYLLDSSEIGEPEICEWIAMERLCCPFLMFQLERGGTGWRLKMRGPDGAKALLQEEFRGGVKTGGVKNG